MTSRRATHAGSWYSGNKEKLNRQMEQFLDLVPESGETHKSLPIPGARFLVGPHAGYTWAGKTLAETYKAWDTTNIKRVFILGPSHHVYFKGAMLSPFHIYETPLGDIPVDRDVVDELKRLGTGIFKIMSTKIDEDEHSFEMHMPFIYKLSTNNGEKDPTPVIPILVGDTDIAFDKKLATILAPYFKDKSNAFVISTDFCHWGSRFGFTSYTDSKSVNELRTLTRISRISPGVPIYKSIEYLDKLAMKTASTGSYEKFNDYIKRTDNTICGRTPLSILLKTIELVNETEDEHEEYGLLKWIGYSQSGKVVDISDSSVSYASGYAIC